MASSEPPMPKDKAAEVMSHVNATGSSVQECLGRPNDLAKKAKNVYNIIRTDTLNLSDITSPLLSALPDVTETAPVKEMIDKVVDGIPALLGLLDQVAQIHPFVKLAVGAFRVAIDLHLKRKENDKRVSLLLAAMRDTMVVLVQLKGINEPHCAGGRNITIAESMQDLVRDTAKDIKNCANSCDAYAKTFFVSKVLLSGSWGDEFKKYMECFIARRGDFLPALSIHTGQAVNAANDKLNAAHDKLDTACNNVAIVNVKVDRILSYLEVCMPPDERELTQVIDGCGGPQAVMQDKAILQQLFDSRANDADVSGRRRDFADLQQELREGVQATITENMAQFQDKFDNLVVQLSEALQDAMRHEGDRVIAEVTYGPHNSILDPDIYEIWKQMHWRGSVRGREFVIALRDRFREKFHGLKGFRNDATLAPTPDLWLSDQDAWALKYLDGNRVQAIIEAFDDAAAPSGYISVAEVNAFTTSPRPYNWSLLHWLAYWAVGRQIVMSHYVENIDILLAKMFALKRAVLPANRNGVDEYLHHVWTRSTTLTAAFRRPVDIDEGLLDRFKDYMQADRKRLMENLEAAKYSIDGEGTLNRICGPGPIEKHVFPLLYLLLKRDFEIMRLACEECLHVNELRDSMRSILSVFGAVDRRYEALADSFKQQGLEPFNQFKVFAFEMFKYMDDQDELLKLDFQDISFDETLEAQDVEPTRLVTYPLQMREELFRTRPIGEAETDLRADPVVRKILGHWNGFCGERNLYPSQSMISLDLQASPADSKRFQCMGIAPNGTEWNLAGGYTVVGKRKVQYIFSITYSDHYAPQHFSAELDESGTTLSGSWGHRDKPFPFIFKRLSSEVMRFYPSPTELALNRSRALWRFSIYAIRDQISRRRRSWWWLRKRWETGQRYAKLVMRGRDSGISQFAPEEVAELARYQRAMTSEEARLFNIFIDLCERSVPIHWEVQCKACGEDPIRGSRILCITCGMPDLVNTCDKRRCLATVVRPEGGVHHSLAFPHRPLHDVLKLRTAIHPIRECGEVYRTARSASEKLRQVFADLPSRGSRTLGGKRLPTCVKCRGCVRALPCWYCIECKGDVYLCVSCDAKYGGITAGDHKDTHALVQCLSLRNPVEAESEHPRPGGPHYHCMRHPPEETPTPSSGIEWMQQVDEFFHHPLKAVSALGAKAAESVQGCIHG